MLPNIYRAFRPPPTPAFAQAMAGLPKRFARELKPPELPPAFAKATAGPPKRFARRRKLPSPELPSPELPSDRTTEQPSPEPSDLPCHALLVDSSHRGRDTGFRKAEGRRDDTTQRGTV